MTDRPNTFVGLDMAGAHTRCLVTVADGARINYLGCGTMPPAKWDSSEAQESQMTAESVLEAICEAERSAGLTVVSAVLGVGGARVRSSLVHSSVRLERQRDGVTLQDVGNAVGKCVEGVVDETSIALQLLPLRFVAGSAGAMLNPLGVRTEILEAFVRVISSGKDDHDTARRLVNRTGVNVEETVLSGFAAAYATLLEKEYTGGVAHLDIGKTASSLTAFCEGELRMARGIPVGRDHIVDDVARAFVTGPSIASTLISDFGSAYRDEEMTAAYVLVPDPDAAVSGRLTRPWPRKMPMRSSA